MYIINIEIISEEIFGYIFYKYEEKNEQLK